MIDSATLLGLDLEHWEIIGAAAGAVGAVGALVAAAYRRVVRPMLAAVRRGLEHLDEVRDEVLGTDERPSLAARVEAVQAAVDEHLRWHGGGAASNGRPTAPAPIPVPARRR